MGRNNSGWKEVRELNADGCKAYIEKIKEHFFLNNTTKQYRVYYCKRSKPGRVAFTDCKTRIKISEESMGIFKEWTNSSDHNHESKPIIPYEYKDAFPETLKTTLVGLLLEGASDVKV